MEKAELKKKKREEAEKRQSKYDTLTVAERVTKLDTKLGKGVGATKQRNKLALALAKPIEKTKQKGKRGKK